MPVKEAVGKNDFRIQPDCGGSGKLPVTLDEQEHILEGNENFAVSENND